MSEPYDCTKDTEAHIARVAELLGGIANELIARGRDHDRSKLGAVEKPIFDKITPKLRDMPYGSDEYKRNLAQLSVHYASNRHHPEHFDRGIMGMTLVDLIEMLMDWKAAGERHADGNIIQSLWINCDRFAIPPSLRTILENTIREYWPEAWDDKEQAPAEGG